MKCPFCNTPNSHVKDSRTTNADKTIRRRRYCRSCNGKFTTFERIQIRELLVIKRTGVKRPFDRVKILNSISTALRKRNYTHEQIEQFSNEIVLELESATNQEIQSRMIGTLIMKKLAKLDPVAYIRFASVYKDFATVQDFAKFISKIKHDV